MFFLKYFLYRFCIKFFFVCEYCILMIIFYDYKEKGKSFSLSEGCCFGICLKNLIFIYDKNVRVRFIYRLLVLWNKFLFLSYFVFMFCNNFYYVKCYFWMCLYVEEWFTFLLFILLRVVVCYFKYLLSGFFFGLKRF